MSNYTIPQNCVESSLCVEEYGQLNYIPSLGGNAFYLACFSLALLSQIGLGIKFRTWGFMSAMIGGCGLEIVGYIARIMLHNDIFNNNYFIIYLVGLTIGPAFFSAAIYLSLSRIITTYGPTLSILSARKITAIFIGCDLVSLILQAAGGAIASLADTEADGDMGVNIMIAGLATQVASTFFFCLLCGHLMWAIRKHPHKVNQDSVQFRREFRFRAFLYGEYLCVDRLQRSLS
jgi:RTA1 like protein